MNQIIDELEKMTGLNYADLRKRINKITKRKIYVCKCGYWGYNPTLKINKDSIIVKCGECGRIHAIIPIENLQSLKTMNYLTNPLIELALSGL